MTDAAQSADKWNELATKFKSQADGAGGSQLRAISDRNDESQDVVPWRVHGTTSDMLREQFKLRSAEAARALGAVLKETSLLNMWLHRLCQHLVDESSPLMRPSVGPMYVDGTTVSVELPAIDKVCEASAAFCLSLQHQALESELNRKALAQRFQAWIVENSSAPELIYWSMPQSMRGWVSSVARCAKTSIPIDFLSARLYAFRLPCQPSKFGSLRAFFDQIAREEGLMWGITERGLWMAQQPPSTGAYIDANGSQRAKDHVEEANVASRELAVSLPSEHVKIAGSPRLPHIISTSTQAWKLIEIDFTLRLKLVTHGWAEDHQKEKNMLLAESRRRGNTAYLGPAWVDMQISDTNKRAEWYFKTCCEIWDIQGRPKCKAFFRAVFDWCLQPMFGMRAGCFKHDLELHQTRTRRSIPQDQSALLRSMKQKMDRLCSEWNDRLEIATRDAEYQAQQNREREGQAINEIRMRSFFTEAFAPPPPVSPALAQELRAVALASAKQPQISQDSKPGGETSISAKVDTDRKAALLKRLRTAKPEGCFRTEEAAFLLGLSPRTINRRVTGHKLTQGPSRGTITESSVKRAYEASFGIVE